jgi:AcrR family transcriptional regulator
MNAKRMTKEERRLQLLETAFDIIRRRGSAALSLVSLAEEAGVSRPVTYEHFGTREGLLLALFRRFDEELGRAIDEAVRLRGDTLEQAAEAISTAYVEAVVAAGPECGAVTAALSAHEDTRSFWRTSRDFYVERLRSSLRLRSSFHPADDTPILLGILSALDGLSQEAVTGRLTSAEAISAAVRIIVRSLTYE